MHITLAYHTQPYQQLEYYTLYALQSASVYRMIVCLNTTPAPWEFVQRAQRKSYMDTKK